LVSRAEPVLWSVLSQDIFEQSGKGIFNDRHLDLAAWLVDTSGRRVRLIGPIGRAERAKAKE